MNTTMRLLIGMALTFLSMHFHAGAQDTSNQPVRVAVLAPLYIDSAFNGNTYKLGNTSIPKYFIPGLDFYNGAMLAIDSLQKEHQQFAVTVFDTKKAGQTTQQLLAQLEQEHFSLVVAAISGSAEQKLVSDFSFKTNTPVISATYPNDAGLTANPFFVMLNSSLRTHVEGLHKYMQKNHAYGKIIYLTRKGTLEEKIRSQFAAKDTSYPRLKYAVTEMPDNFTAEQLLPFLDSTKQNIIFCGSLNEAFGTNLLNILCNAPAYKATAIGMPTWDGLKAVANSNCKQVEIVYSTPFNFSRTDKTGASLSKQYRAKFMNRPSDMVFKGFESMYHFSKLMLQHRSDFINHLSDSTAHIATDFNIEPARLTNTSFVPDYLENKKLYFIKVQAGSIKSTTTL
ncbi:type 1 periplasmic-binding domain-containing protein [Deminuibacter soli]|nr:ABC transporter substrate-binding protein [Deminuibacter soli]